MASYETDLSRAEWRKSSYSNGDGGDCVEVATNLPGTVPVRDTKLTGTETDPAPTLLITPGAWSAFLAEITA
ncbi:DUF397 domain-containing protein [Streptomyces sp. NPDC050145]|uniref:DUF397 domain-containing protein n=1 Tax=Streptomyces sp. NPDC050145 TaxID=3365602 RepID=UPI00378E2994